MRQLLLLRHAKSDWNDPLMSDHARPLNARGRQAAAALRQAFRTLALQPQLVLVSSARRTVQTLDALGPWDDPPRIQTLDALYLATPATLLNVLHGVDAAISRVLLVGHNPGIHELALQLAGRASSQEAQRIVEGLPTGGLVEFAVDDDWALLEAGTATLLRFVAPRDLPGANAAMDAQS